MAAAAAGSASHELKSRGKPFVQWYLAGHKDAITQATVLFVSPNRSQASYARAFPMGQANTEGTFVNMHGLISCKC